MNHDNIGNRERMTREIRRVMNVESFVNVLKRFAVPQLTGVNLFIIGIVYRKILLIDVLQRPEHHLLRLLGIAELIDVKGDRSFGYQVLVVLRADIQYFLKTLTRIFLHEQRRIFLINHHFLVRNTGDNIRFAIEKSCVAELVGKAHVIEINDGVILASNLVVFLKLAFV